MEKAAWDSIRKATFSCDDAILTDLAPLFQPNLITIFYMQCVTHRRAAAP